MVDFIAWGSGIIASYGLIGLFVMCVITASTVILYAPGWMFVILAGHFYNPFLVGLVAALGYTVGETTSYLVGRGGNYFLEKKKSVHLEKVQGWFKKHGFILFPLFAAGPLPVDLLGIVAGTLKYDIRKFWLGVFLGEIIKCTAYAFAGYYGFKVLGF
jgi:uncharacterized membrane protein YdjX (TVP38/TMEM64 family)